MLLISIDNSSEGIKEKMSCMLPHYALDKTYILCVCVCVSEVIESTLRYVFTQQHTFGFIASLPRILFIPPIKQKACLTGHQHCS